MCLIRVQSFLTCAYTQYENIYLYQWNETLTATTTDWIAYRASPNAFFMISFL